MKCPTCVANGERSKVHSGVSMTTLMNGSVYYDEDGRYHNHDPNIVTTSYRCSNGHSWSMYEGTDCRACTEDSVDV